jgi:hypothetical protein
VGTGSLTLEVKRPGRGVGHPSTSSAHKAYYGKTFTFIFYVKYTEVSVYNTTILIPIHYIVYIQGDMFRPSMGHPQALKEYGSGYIYVYILVSHPEED